MGVNPRESPPPHRGYKMGYPVLKPVAPVGWGGGLGFGLGVVVALACVCLYVCVVVEGDDGVECTACCCVWWLSRHTTLGRVGRPCGRSSPGGMVTKQWHVIYSITLGRVGRPCGRPRQVVGFLADCVGLVGVSDDPR